MKPGASCRESYEHFTTPTTKRLAGSPSRRRTIACTSSPALLPESIAAFAPKKVLPIGGKATLIQRPGRFEDSEAPEMRAGRPPRDLLLSRAQEIVHV